MVMQQKSGNFGDPNNDQWLPGQIQEEQQEIQPCNLEGDKSENPLDCEQQQSTSGMKLTKMISVESTSQDDQSNPIQKAILMFTEHVAVAGLEQAYKEKLLAEKIMWCIAYLLALAGIAVTCYGIAYTYMTKFVFYDDLQKFGEQAPFPNVTICIPEALDKKKLRRMLVITNQTRRTIGRRKLNMGAVINQTLDIWHYNFEYINTTKGPNAQLAFRIIDDTAPGNLAGKLEEVLPSCKQVLSDCYFDGVRFDCCQGVKPVAMVGPVCYEISVSLQVALKKLARHNTYFFSFKDTLS